MTTIIIVIIIFHIVCARLSFLFFQMAHYHKNGRWQNIESHNSDLFFVFLPLLNILPAIEYLRGKWKKDELQMKSRKNFFKPKQKLK